MMVGVSSVIDMALSDLASDKAFLETLGGDLSRFGLVNHPGFNSVMSDAGLKAGRGTSKGTEFLALITAPDDSD